MKRFLAGVFFAGLVPLGCSGSSTTGSSSTTGATTGAGGASTTTGAGGSATTGTGGASTTTGTGGASTTVGTGGGSTTTGSGGAGGAPGCVIDGMVTPPEQCDDGNATDGDGCDSDCTFSCVDPVADCPAAPPCKQNACLASHTCATAADPAQDGSACAANSVCKAGVCAPIVCGDGVMQGAEQCDFGAGNGPGKGCELNCTFSCTKAPDSCADAETCNGVEICTTFVNGAQVGQKCAPGVQMLDCSACAAGVCGSGMCKASSCGDGCVDPAKGEQCEPPGTVMCDASCKTVVVSPCGNGVRDAGEQCDDGNQVNLDGCDATCKFEQDLRSNYLKMQFSPDPFCGNANQFGAAIAAGVPQQQVQSDIDQGIAAGTGGFVIKLLDLASLTGADDPMLQVGAMRATHVAGAAYSGVNDLEWWYTVNGASIDAARNPLDKLAGTLFGNVINAGPGAMSLAVDLFPSGTTVFRLSSAKIQALVGASFAPGASAGTPPGHLASEHLDPALQSFATLGQPDANFSGKLCGNASTKGLAQTPAPTELLPGGTFPCLEGYSAASSLLDVLVTGCTINVGVILQVVMPTQPDKADPAAPVGGAGAPYKLGVNAQKIVTSCADKNNVAVPLATCLDAAAYSTYFRFAMDRVILK
jgi:cysteine-rich repeat protein